MDAIQVGKFIKELRKKENLTQKEFADKLGITYQAVSKWENGKNMPDIFLLKEISAIFKVDIEELLDGEKKPTNKLKNDSHNKKNKIFFFGTIFLFITIIIILSILFLKKDDSFEFKTMKSTCKEFTLNGSAAYNQEKTSIYISDVDYCGKENNTIYKNIECTLYEDYKDTKTKIGTCGKSENIKLDDFLATIELNVNNYVASCKMFTSSSLYLEIQATESTDKKVTYEIPIQLEENCKK